MLEINTELIRKAQKGDIAVIGALYERYHLPVFQYLYYRVGDQQTAEDLTSEVFLRMLRFLGGFRPPSASFQAWLFQIARNLATDYFRKAGGRIDLELKEELVATKDNLDAAVEQVFTGDVLRRALNRLSDDQRDVIVMRFVSSMPIGEVAQALNRSEDAVKGLQRRALAALREILSDWEVDYVRN